GSGGPDRSERGRWSSTTQRASERDGDGGEVEACPPLDDEPAGRLAGGRLVVAASTGQRADPRTVTMDRCEATWSGPVAPGPSNPTTGLQLPITRARASATTSDARRRRRGPSNVSAARRRAPRSGGAFRAAAEHAVTARRRPARSITSVSSRPNARPRARPAWSGGSIAGDVGRPGRPAWLRTTTRRSRPWAPQNAQNPRSVK